MNPILDIAARLADGKLSEEAACLELQQLSRSGQMTADSLNEALVFVLQAQPLAAVPLVFATVVIAVTFLKGVGDRQGVGTLLCAAANHMGGRLEDPQTLILALSTAAYWYAECHLYLDSGDKRIGACYLHAATILDRLADLGVDPMANYDKALLLCSKAAPCFPAGSHPAGLCLMNTATILQSLAKVGVEPTANYEKAISLYAEASPCFPTGSPDAGLCLMNEATAWLRLADLGVEPEANYGKAIVHYTEATSCFPAGSPDAGLCLMNTAITLQHLADLGVDPEANYGKAIVRYAEAMFCFPAGSPNAGLCLMNTANTWQGLASVGVEPEVNCRKAISLYAEASPCFPTGSRDTGDCLINAANAWQRLSNLGVEPEANYGKAISLYAEATLCFPPGSPSFGYCLLNTAHTWQCLADEGVDPVANYGKALELHSQAMLCLDRDSFDRAKEAHNYAGALKSMAGHMNQHLEKHRYLSQALSLLRNDAMPTLERIGETFRNDTERRSFRETYQMLYRRMISVCFELAALETNPEQAEALRWEAWQWVQRSKARTMQESMAAFAVAAQAHDPAQPEIFKKLMLEQAELDRQSSPDQEGTRSAGGEPEVATDVQSRLYDFISQLLHQAAPQSIKDETAAKEPLACALARMACQDRPVIVVEFFSADDGRIGAFIHPAGSTTGLQEPVWLEGDKAMTAELAQTCRAASALLSRDPRYRARDRSAGLAESKPAAEEIRNARKQMDSVAADMGALLAPVREFIQQQGWADASLLLCPTGHLHLLPLAAAHWGVDEQGEPLPLIAAHALLHLPTAALATEVIKLERPVSATRSAFIAAADPWRKLTAIYREADDAATQLKAKGFSVTQVERADALADTLHQHGPGVDVVHLAMHSAMNESRFELCGAEFHDRLLAVLELMRWLRFQNAQLAIIATCSSGQAMDLNADDPSAITRAWMLAGAPSVIGGLWPLGDEPAYQFSTTFYQHWTNGIPLADAVRAAMLHVRAEYPNDIYSWAPFILVGNGATVI